MWGEEAVRFLILFFLIMAVPAVPSAQGAGRVAALDGTWTLSLECGPHGAPGSDVTFKGGHIEGMVDAGQDVLLIDAYVADDGKIEGFFNGNLVGGPLTGSVASWQQGRVAGEMVLRGEIVCYGTWQARKAN